MVCFLRDTIYSILNSAYLFLGTLFLYNFVQITLRLLSNNVKNETKLIKFLLILLALSITLFGFRYFGRLVLNFMDMNLNIAFNVGLTPFIVVIVTFSILWMLVNFKLKLT